MQRDSSECFEREPLRVSLSGNAAMVLLYSNIAPTILEQQGREWWGPRVIDRLSTDLLRALRNTSLTGWYYRVRRRGSSASRSPSPTKLKARTAKKMAMPGKVAMLGLEKM